MLLSLGLRARKAATTTTRAVLEESKAVSGAKAITQLYRTPGLSESATKTLLKRAKRVVSDSIDSIDCERCFNIEVVGELTDEEAAKLRW